MKVITIDGKHYMLVPVEFAQTKSRSEMAEELLAALPVGMSVEISGCRSHLTSWAKKVGLAFKHKHVGSGTYAWTRLETKRFKE